MAISPSSATSVVLDASALIRALVNGNPAALQWLSRAANEEVLPAWPAHLYAEVANALLRLCRAGAITVAMSGRAFAHVRLMPADVASLTSMEDAIVVALERSLTPYDAAYVVLAEALDAPLVTADRRLAEATANAVLV